MSNMLERGHGISILIPFRADDSERRRIFDWLLSYWSWNLPEAQIIIGSDEGTPFSKTCAINEAARCASGDIFVLADADMWINPQVILEAAHRIRVACANHRRRWYIPYRSLWRLTKHASEEILERNPAWIEPPDELCFDLDDWIENCDESGVGHNFGALIQIMPREAFFEVGGGCERFRGWGGEDVSLMMALDTLYTRHRTLDKSVFTFFHEPKGRRHHRKWFGQLNEDPNGSLAARYHAANGDVERMRALVDEGIEWAKRKLTD